MAEKGTAGDAPAPSGTGARDSSQSPLVVAPVRSLSRRHRTISIPRVIFSTSFLLHFIFFLKFKSNQLIYYFILVILYSQLEFNLSV
jgi:hypothetical protein